MNIDFTTINKPLLKILRRVRSLKTFVEKHDLWGITVEEFIKSTHSDVLDITENLKNSIEHAIQAYDPETGKVGTGGDYYIIYNSNGDMVEELEYGDTLTKNEYDRYGNITLKNISKNGRTEESIIYSYNSAGLLTKTMSDKNGVSIYDYDSDGKLLLFQDTKGNIEKFEYSSTGKKLKHSGTFGWREYTYDDKDNLTSTKYNVKTGYGCFSIGETVYRYDSKNRLMEIVRTDNKENDITQYMYDQNGDRLTKHENGEFIRDIKPKITEEIIDGHLLVKAFDTVCMDIDLSFKTKPSNSINGGKRVDIEVDTSKPLKLKVADELQDKFKDVLADFETINPLQASIMKLQQDGMMYKNTLTDKYFEMTAPKLEKKSLLKRIFYRKKG